MSKDSLYLDDLSPGMRFTAGPITLTEDAIIAFAREFDPQSFHTDPETAATSFFRGHVASGWQTAAVTMRMLVDGAMPFAGGAIGLGVEISWPRAVRPGDALSVVLEIMDITPSSSKPGRAVATLKTTTTNQNGEIVQVMTSKNIVFKRGYLPGERKG
ncbi:MAG TPA: MaoC family dehydratase [Geobacterales bacterium]|nr:MaoC family dehydratase [Geobacterales bacterium]